MFDMKITFICGSTFYLISLAGSHGVVMAQVWLWELESPEISF